VPGYRDLNRKGRFFAGTLAEITLDCVSLRFLSLGLLLLLQGVSAKEFLLAIVIDTTWFLKLRLHLGLDLVKLLKLELLLGLRCIDVSLLTIL